MAYTKSVCVVTSLLHIHFMCNISYIKEKKEGDSLKRRKVKSIKQLGNTGTQLEKEVAAMEESMKQHNIEENCQKLIDGLMPQIKDMERTLYGTYHRILLNIPPAVLKVRKVLWKSSIVKIGKFLLLRH